MGMGLGLGMRDIELGLGFRYMGLGLGFMGYAFGIASQGDGFGNESDFIHTNMQMVWSRYGLSNRNLWVHQWSYRKYGNGGPSLTYPEGN